MSHILPSGGGKKGGGREEGGREGGKEGGREGREREPLAPRSKLLTNARIVA